jgi:hypothetical protein
MAYAFAVGQTTMAVSGLALAICLALVSMRISPAQGRRTTRYRASSWAHPDWIVASASLMALLIFFWRNWAVTDAAVFNPYPRLSWPGTDLWMLLGLALLIVPALIVPAAGEVV